MEYQAAIKRVDTLASSKTITTDVADLARHLLRRHDTHIDHVEPTEEGGLAVVWSTMLRGIMVCLKPDKTCEYVMTNYVVDRGPFRDLRQVHDYVTDVTTAPLDLDDDRDPPERHPWDREERREHLAMVVRGAWVSYCHETGDTKPSHLLGWNDLDEWNREADRRIADAIERQVGQDIHDLRHDIGQMAQMCHQAYHLEERGSWRDCPRSTCKRAQAALAAIPEPPRV